MKITIKNRLAILIRQRQINSASEFGRRMTAAGFPMSSSHASRYEKEAPPGFDVKFLNVACNVLQCTPNELYEIIVELEPGEVVDPMVVLPRHAILYRQEAHTATVAASHTPAATVTTQPLPPPKAPASESIKDTTRHVETKSRVAAKGKPAPAIGCGDTGPSGVIFPFKQ